MKELSLFTYSVAVEGRVQKGEGRKHHERLTAFIAVKNFRVHKSIQSMHRPISRSLGSVYVLIHMKQPSLHRFGNNCLLEKSPLYL